MGQDSQQGSDSGLRAAIESLEKKLAAAKDAAEAAERATEAANARFLAAAEAQLDGLAIFDADDRLVFYNSRFPSHVSDAYRSVLALGVTFEDLLRRALAAGSVFHPDMAADHLARRLALHRQPSAEHEVRLADGRWFRVRENAMADGGRILLTTEVTEHKRAEERLRRSEEMLRVVTDEAPVMLTMYDAENQLVFASKRVLDFAGRSWEAVKGRGWEQDVHPDDLAAMLAEYGENFRLQRASDLQYRMRRHDGAYRWVRKFSVPRYGADGAFAGFVSALEDVTERKEAEAEVARQREALHHSEKLTALGSLLAGVSHELNNPLSVVVAQATLLLETASDVKALERGQKIKAAADRCAKIVKTFLAMARRRPPERRAVALNEIVESSLEVLAYGLRSAGIEVVRELGPAVPLLRADGDQLHQVVTNLVLNAQQAMSAMSEPRRLRVAIAFDREAGEIRLSVADSGPGVPAELRSRIFEPFFTTKPAGYGTGVGLSLCHGVIESHGGRIAVDDAPGGGARFTVTLPYAPPEAVDRRKEERKAAAGGRSILIVDDEADIVDTYAEILAADGHRCDVAENGRVALERVAARRYDLILSDLRMPELDGPGLHRALLGRDPAMADRILFLTGDTLSPEVQRFLDQLRRPSLEKPVEPARLRRAVAEALAALDAAQPAGPPAAS